MNEDNQVHDQEDLLEDATSDEDILSSDESVTLEDKLDRVEALLNEEIALRENEEDLENEDSVMRTTSGAEPNYNQYIYDLLTDSTIKVEIVEEQDITEKPLNDYSISDALNVILIVLILFMFAYKFITEYVFKFKRR